MAPTPGSVKAKAAGNRQQRLPRPTATAPAADSTLLPLEAIQFNGAKACIQEGQLWPTSLDIGDP